MQIVGLSDLGKVRENQEDAWVIREPGTGSERRLSGRLLLVADGIGGSRAGEVASGLAASTIPDAYFGAAGAPRARLRFAVQEANRIILEGTEAAPQNRGMGTTVAAAVIHGDRLTVAWVGDSRAYLVRDRSLLCLTRDHRGSNLAGLAPSSGGLSRWLGMAISVDPDIREVTLHPGDRILLCTDGLHGVVREDDILRSAGSSAGHWASSLVQLALRQGAPDNVTVVCAHVDRLPFAPHRHPGLMPGIELDNLTLLDQVGADSIHVWYLARRGSAIRLVCALRPELQGDTGLILDLEADEESLARIGRSSVASVEGVDVEKSLAYVCLRLPWQSGEEEIDEGVHEGVDDQAARIAPTDTLSQARTSSYTELHSLADVLEMLREPPGASGIMDAMEITAQVADALSAVRDSMLPAGAPHPADFWGTGESYALCRWPGVQRPYCIQTGKGVQAHPAVRPWMPPDFGAADLPGPAADAFFCGWLLSHLLGLQLPGGAADASTLPAPVSRLLDGLLAEMARDRPQAETAIRNTIEAIGRPGV